MDQCGRLRFVCLPANTNTETGTETNIEANTNKNTNTDTRKDGSVWSFAPCLPPCKYKF